jgi:hypothetical protein
MGKMMKDNWEFLIAIMQKRSGEMIGWGQEK